MAAVDGRRNVASMQAAFDGIDLPRWNTLAPVYGHFPHTLAAADELQRLGEPLFQSRFGKFRLSIHSGRSSLWILVRNRAGAGLAMRGVYAPDSGLHVKRCDSRDGGIDLLVQAPSMGTFEIGVDVLASDVAPLFRCRVVLTPAADLLMPKLPWNVYPIDEQGSPLPTRGIVHAAQHHTAAAVLHFSITKPRFGTALYFQNLSALNEYCELTHTSAAGVVGEHWPGLGYTPPPLEKEPLPAGKPINICDAFVAVSPELPKNDCEVARLFLDLLAEVYAHLPRPAISYHDWPAMARSTLRDLTHSSKLSIEQQGQLYLQPYVSSEYPDSTVQLAVLVPLVKYLQYAGLSSHLEVRLRRSLSQFYDPELKTFTRYLSTVGCDKDPYAVDSWYFWHPLRNLAILAKDDDESARKIFFDSIARGIDAAHHFKHRWPVKYDLRTLDVIEGPRKDGEPGQTDVPGLYAYVMIQAYELSGQRRYLDEAATALKSLDGLGFVVGYQFNTVAWGITAAVKLAKLTRKPAVAEHSLRLLASFFHHCTLWQCTFGPAKHHPTFMSVTCLHDGPYIAAFEEFEAAVAFEECFATSADHLPRSARMLMSEYYRYALNHCWYYYPSELPADILAKEVRNGHIDRSLAIPLEDLHADWKPPGEVGQEVYGSGMAFAFSATAYHKLDGAAFAVFCDYPLTAPPQVKRRVATLLVGGEPDYGCVVRLLSREPAVLRGITVQLRQRGSRKTVIAIEQARIAGQRSFAIPGGSTVVITWTQGADLCRTKPRRSTKKRSRNGSKTSAST